LRGLFPDASAPKLSETAQGAVPKRLVDAKLLVVGGIHGDPTVKGNDDRFDKIDKNWVAFGHQEPGSPAMPGLEWLHGNWADWKNSFVDAFERLSGMAKKFDRAWIDRGTYGHLIKFRVANILSEQPAKLEKAIAKNPRLKQISLQQHNLYIGTLSEPEKTDLHNQILHPILAVTGKELIFDEEAFTDNMEILESILEAKGFKSSGDDIVENEHQKYMVFTHN